MTARNLGTGRDERYLKKLRNHPGLSRLNRWILRICGYTTNPRTSGDSWISRSVNSVKEFLLRRVIDRINDDVLRESYRKLIRDELIEQMEGTREI